MRIHYHHSAECQELSQLPDGATIVAVDGKPCVGRCEGCGTPVLMNEDGFLLDGARQWDDGIVTCAPCSPAEGELQ